MAEKQYRVKSFDSLPDDVEPWEIDEINNGTHPIFKQGLGAKLGVPGRATPATSAVQPRPPMPRDTTYGMGTMDLTRAGVGKTIDDWTSGVANKAMLMNLPDSPVMRKAILDRMNQEKADKANVDQQLMQNPAAIAGQVLGYALPSVAAPVRLGAQMALQGGLGALSSPVKPVNGPLNELSGSAIRGAEDALGTWAGGKLVEGAGRGINALRGNYTPEGAQMMELSDAAQRLGLPSPSIGELDPNSIMGILHSSSMSRPARARESGEALKRALSSEVPTAEGPRVVSGGKYIDELKGAVQGRYNQAHGKYDAVDQFVQANGLDNIKPQNTFSQLGRIAQKFTPQGSSHDVNPVLNLLTKYDPEAFDWVRSLGANPTKRYVAQTIRDGIPVSNYHDMRVAVNKAWSVVNRQLARDPTSAATQEMEKELNGLRRALDSDAGTWAAQNSGNAEAMKLYGHANDFWKTVVAPAVLDNPVARKLSSRVSPYLTGEQAINSTTSTANRPLVDLLSPTLSDRGADMVRVTRGLPDAAKYVVSGETPKLAPSLTSLALLAPSFVRAPVRVAGSLAEELGGLSRTEALKRLYAARLAEGPLARMGYGAAQYPAQGVEGWLDRLGSTGP